MVWYRVEPEEGQFDFSVLDDLLAGCRAHGLKLMPLWCGTWKNGQMEYTPNRVKSNPERFRRAVPPAGCTIPVLSSQREENRLVDECAFTALMRAAREKDAQDRLIVAVQVEGEREFYLAGGPLPRHLQAQARPGRRTHARRGG